MDYRLKRNEDFDRLFKSGKRSFSKSLTFIYAPSESLKIGYSVSKKHGKAVLRNRIKRLLRAAVKSEIKSLGNYHIVLLPKVRDEYSYHLFLSDIKSIIKKENLSGEN